MNRESATVYAMSLLQEGTRLVGSCQQHSDSGKPSWINLVKKIRIVSQVNEGRAIFYIEPRQSLKGVRDFIIEPQK